MFQRYNIVATDGLRTALARTEEYRDAEAENQRNSFFSAPKRKRFREDG
jgi:hypothetical protein